MEKKSEGIGLQLDNIILFTLHFANYQVLIAQDKEDLQYMVRKIKEEYEKRDLEMLSIWNWTMI